MICQQFHDAYQEMLDRQMYDVTEPAMVEHLASCPACTRYAKMFKEIDLALREGAEEEVPVPPELARKLRAIPAETKERFAPDEFWTDLEHAGLYAAGAVAVVVVAGFCPPTVATALQMCVLTAGLTKFTLVSLRRLFLN